MEIIVEELGNVLELANIYVEIQPANVRVPYVKSMIVMNYVSLMWLGTAVNQIILHMFVTVVPKRNFVPTRDLRRKTTYRKRKRTKSKNPAYVSSCRIGRTYEDFTKYMESKDTDIVVEMDTVIGRKGSGNRLLTMIFRKNSVMLAFLLPDGKAESVKNHEFIRYAIPKGKTLNAYTQTEITLLTNHINSVRRPSLGHKSPYEMAADDENMQLLFKLLKMHPIPPDEVRLSPDIFKSI